MRQYIALGIVVLLVVVAGCSEGGGGDGGNADGTQAPGANGGNGGFGGGSGDGGSGGGDGGSGGGDGTNAGGGFGSMATCEAGEAISSTDPQTGQTVSWQIQGMVTYDGRDVCKATFQASGMGQSISQGEMYFDPDGTYRKIVYRDSEGNVVMQMDVSGGVNGTMGMGDISVNGSVPGMNVTMPNMTGMNVTMPSMNVTVPDMNVTVSGSNYTIPG